MKRRYQRFEAEHISALALAAQVSGIHHPLPLPSSIFFAVLYRVLLVFI